MEVLTLKPVKNVQGNLRLPGSKSITNRALLLAALSAGTTRLQSPLISDDTELMMKALRQLGCKLEEGKDSIKVTGIAGFFGEAIPHEADLFLGNAGTAMRPLVAALCIAGGGGGDRSFYLHGEPRMHQRPIADLVTSLQAMGADICYEMTDGYPPLRIKNTGLAGGQIKMNVEKSSQYITALLMAAPFAQKETEIELLGKVVSRPYIEMTMAMMESFGVKVQADKNWRKLTVPATGAYTAPRTFAIEGDASSASYFLAAGAIAGGPVRVEGIDRSSLQGDIAFAKVLQKMGAEISYGNHWIQAAAGTALKGVELDLGHIPDAAMTLATTALFASSPTFIGNIGNWRIKETDRLKAMAIELGKLGAQVEEREDSLKIYPPSKLQDAEIATYNDHRMAMSFALAALGNASIRIQNPACVSKTFPEYFDEFKRLCR